MQFRDRGGRCWIVKQRPRFACVRNGGADGANVPEVSLFSCMLLLSGRGPFDYAESNCPSRLSRQVVLPSPLWGKGRRPDGSFRSSIAPPTDALVYFKPRLATVPARPSQGQDGAALSFRVGFFHPLQHSGLARRTPQLCVLSTAYGWSNCQPHSRSSAAANLVAAIH
jgi:hypothetical protein